MRILALVVLMHLDDYQAMCSDISKSLERKYVDIANDIMCEARLCIEDSTVTTTHIDEDVFTTAIEIPDTAVVTFYYSPSVQVEVDLPHAAALIGTWMCTSSLWRCVESEEDCAMLPNELIMLLTEGNSFYSGALADPAELPGRAKFLFLSEVRNSLYRQGLPGLNCIDFHQSPFSIQKTKTRACDGTSHCVREVHMPAEIMAAACGIAATAELRKLTTSFRAGDVLLNAIVPHVCVSTVSSFTRRAVNLDVLVPLSATVSSLLDLCTGVALDVPLGVQEVLMKSLALRECVSNGELILGNYTEAVAINRCVMWHVNRATENCEEVLKGIHFGNLIRSHVHHVPMRHMQIPSCGIAAEFGISDKNRALSHDSSREEELLGRCRTVGQAVQQLLFIANGAGTVFSVGKACVGSSFVGARAFLYILRSEAFALGLAAEYNVGAVELLDDRIIIGAGAVRPLMLHLYVRMQESCATHAIMAVLPLARELCCMGTAGEFASEDARATLCALSYWLCAYICGQLFSYTPVAVTCNEEARCSRSSLLLPAHFTSPQHAAVCGFVLPLLTTQCVGQPGFLINAHALSESEFYSLRESVLLMCTPFDKLSSSLVVKMPRRVAMAMLCFIWKLSDKVFSQTLFEYSSSSSSSDDAAVVEECRKLTALILSNRHLVIALRWILHMHKYPKDELKLLATNKYMDALKKRHNTPDPSEYIQADAAAERDDERDGVYRPRKAICSPTEMPDERKMVQGMADTVANCKNICSKVDPEDSIEPFAISDTFGAVQTLYNTARLCCINKREVMEPVSRNSGMKRPSRSGDPDGRGPVVQPLSGGVKLAYGIVGDEYKRRVQISVTADLFRFCLLVLTQAAAVAHSRQTSQLLNQNATALLRCVVFTLHPTHKRFALTGNVTSSTVPRVNAAIDMQHAAVKRMLSGADQYPLYNGALLNDANQRVFHSCHLKPSSITNVMNFVALCNVFSATGKYQDTDASFSYYMREKHLDSSIMGKLCTFYMPMICGTKHEVLFYGNQLAELQNTDELISECDIEREQTTRNAMIAFSALCKSKQRSQLIVIKDGSRRPFIVDAALLSTIYMDRTKRYKIRADTLKLL